MKCYFVDNFSEKSENLSGALKYFGQTETDFLLSSRENTKNEPFLIF